MYKIQGSIFSKFNVIFMLFLFACSSSGNNKEYTERSVEEIYNSALNEMEKKNYINAAQEFEEVERQHPYSAWAKQAQIMTAYAKYMKNDYSGAIAAARRYIQLHPGADDVDYAYYLVAISYYERISDVKREQSMTRSAFETLNEMVRRFPDSVYAKDSKQKLILVRDHLAGKDMEVGRTYLSMDNYISAINRFKNVVENYSSTSHVPEALARLTEIYFMLGIIPEAKASAAVLGHNFPNSEWYEYTFELLTEYRQQYSSERNATNENFVHTNKNIDDQTNVTFLDELLSIFDSE